MTATLNGRLCTYVDLVVPRYGNLSGRVQFGDADALPETPGALSLIVAGLTARATLVEQGVRSGQLSADIVGGFGGWGRSVPPLPHGLTANGVKLSAFASDLALAAGETITIAPGVDRALGTVVARLGQQGAAELLSEACASPSGSPIVPWWVGLDGVTTVGPRTGTDSDPEFVDAEDLDRWREYAVDDATSLLPGNTIGGRMIAETRITATGDSVAVRVLLETAGEIQHTFAAKMRRLILGIVGPRVSARTVYRYIVREVYDATRLRAVPVRSLLAPNLPSLRIWPGVPGGRGRPQAGSEILVQFADGDPGYPIVVGFAPAADGTAGFPATSELDGTLVLLGDALQFVARLTDGATAGTVTIAQNVGAAPPGVTVTYAPPTGIPSIFRLDGAIILTPIPPTVAPVVFEVRAEIDAVSQTKVKA